MDKRVLLRECSPYGRFVASASVRPSQVWSLTRETPTLEFAEFVAFLLAVVWADVSK
jgi:hypothetical protein